MPKLQKKCLHELYLICIFAMAMSKVISKSSVQEFIKSYLELGKIRLSLFVILSAFLGYCIGSHSVDWLKAFLLSLGGLLVTISSNTLNQIHEVELDALMSRTQSRPLPLGKLTLKQAQQFALFTGLLGFFILAYFLNLKSALLSLISLIIYAYIYTPLKQKTSFSVFIGAFPGAFPPLIGYVAASNQFDITAWLIFAIQFFWQFPHFWAIAWVAFEDYKKAGLHLLPSKGGRDLNSALQILVYTMILVPVSILPYTYGVVGILYFIVALLSGTIFIYQSVQLLIKRTKQAALQLMFGSFFYLPTVLITFYLDKI